MGAIVQARLKQIPETIKTAQQTGRAELGEDTLGPYYSELVVKLKESDRSRDFLFAKLPIVDGAQQSGNHLPLGDVPNIRRQLSLRCNRPS